MKQQSRRLNPAPRQPYQAANKNAPSAPLLTIERAIADNIPPARLRWVAEANRKAGGSRLERQAAHLTKIAERLELLGYRSAA